jgi:hypothetical protein
MAIMAKVSIALRLTSVVRYDYTEIERDRATENELEPE